MPLGAGGGVLSNAPSGSPKALARPSPSSGALWVPLAAAAFPLAIPSCQLRLGAPAKGRAERKEDRREEARSWSCHSESFPSFPSLLRRLIHSFARLRSSGLSTHAWRCEALLSKAGTGVGGEEICKNSLGCVDFF